MIPSQTFTLRNVLRGRLAERIVSIWLERNGYRVTCLGIEEVVDEVKYLNRDQYLALGLPEQLRKLPDLLVADPAMTWAKLIEVKFRRRFTWETANELFVTLSERRRYWPDSTAVIIIGQPFMEEARFHQDYIRVIPAGETHILLPGGIESEAMVVWERLPMLTSIFRFRDFECFGDQGKQRGREFWDGADFITASIRELGSI
jgi:hypothetical protein